MTRPKPARHSDGGFTLMETLVALAVLAVGSMALLAGVERHAANTRGLEDRIVARWVAENALAAARLDIEIDAALTRAMGIDWYAERDTRRLQDTALDAVTMRVSDRATGPEAALVSITGYVPALGETP